MSDQKTIVVRGGQVYDHDGDVHKPRVADILIKDGNIVAVGQNLDAAGAEIVDARNRLIVPGLINAHYHSHDTLCRGLFEELPLEFWLLYTLPLGIMQFQGQFGTDWARVLAFVSLALMPTVVFYLLAERFDDDVVVAAQERGGSRGQPRCATVTRLVHVAHERVFDLEANTGPIDCAAIRGETGRCCAWSRSRPTLAPSNARASFVVCSTSSVAACHRSMALDRMISMSRRWSGA